MKNRKRRNRKLRRAISIIVEGKTELWYFQLMKEAEKEDLYTIDIKPKLPQKMALDAQFNLVTEDCELFDYVFWVIDLDQIIHNHLTQKLQDYRQKLKDNAFILINNPCLEFWFLLHFQNTGKHYSKCSRVITDLRKHITNYQKTEKFFKTNNVYKIFKPYQEKAIERAKRLSKQATSLPSPKAEIYKIFEVIRKMN
ncbi:MAG: hypothetical protein Kow00108_14150 [Calditrichia bacterium]